MVAALSLALALALPGELLAVETSSCARVVLDVDAFVVQLSLELAPEDVVQVGPGRGARASVRASCREPVLDVALWAPPPPERLGAQGTLGEPGTTTVELAVERAVDLRSVDGALRARALALVVAETWRSRARPSATLSPQGGAGDGPTAPPTAPPAGVRSTPADDAPRDATPGAREPSGEPFAAAATGTTNGVSPPLATPAVLAPELGPEGRTPLPPTEARGSTTLALGPLVRSFPAHDTTLLGARLLGTLALRPWLDLGIEADGSTGVVAHPLGEVRVAIFGAALLAQGHQALGPLQLGLGPRVSLGWAHVWGSSSSPRVAAANGGSIVVMLGARATAELPVAPAWSLVLALDASGVAQGLLAQADADVVATVDGLELGGTLTLRWRPE